MANIEDLFGQDSRFWVTVAVATALKWLFTPDDHLRTRKQAAAGILAGGVCAFYGTDFMVNKFEVLGTDRDIVVIGLVFTGEHIVRTMFNFGPLLARKLLGISESEAKTSKGSNVER